LKSLVTLIGAPIGDDVEDVLLVPPQPDAPSTTRTARITGAVRISR
jgi:hypothetical protein